MNCDREQALCVILPGWLITFLQSYIMNWMYFIQQISLNAVAHSGIKWSDGCNVTRSGWSPHLSNQTSYSSCCRLRKPLFQKYNLFNFNPLTPLLYFPCSLSSSSTAVILKEEKKDNSLSAGCTRLQNRSTTYISPGHGLLPTYRPVFFLPILPRSSIHLPWTPLLPGSSIMKWTPYSGRNTRIHCSSSVGAENPLLEKYGSWNHFLPARSHYPPPTPTSPLVHSHLIRDCA